MRMRVSLFFVLLVSFGLRGAEIPEQTQKNLEKTWAEEFSKMSLKKLKKEIFYTNDFKKRNNKNNFLGQDFWKAFDTKQLLLDVEWANRNKN